EFTPWVPARKAFAVRDAQTHAVIEVQVRHRTADVPIRRILIAGLAESMREIVIYLRFAPHRSAGGAVGSCLGVQDRHAAMREVVAVGAEIQSSLRVRIRMRLADWIV